MSMLEAPLPHFACMLTNVHHAPMIIQRKFPCLIAYCALLWVPTIWMF